MSADEYQISRAGGDGDVTDRIAAIRKSNDTWLQSSVTDRNDRNTKFLLDYIEEQQATIAAVLALANAHGRRGFLVTPADIRATLAP